MIFLIILSIICNVFPMVILPLLYESIPNSIPAFVDVFGNPVVMMEKTYVSIFRLPLMGLLITILCIVMFLIRLSDEDVKKNKMMWAIVSCIGALKMGITSMEVLFYENIEAVRYFRVGVLILVIIGIIILIYGTIKMYRKGLPYKEYISGMAKDKIKIIGVLCAYIIVALMPLYV